MTTKSEEKVGKPLNEVILIDLDVLLDTRLAALFATDWDWTIEVLKSGYRDRVTDSWNDIRPGLDVNKYLEIYNNRDEELLKTAKLTGFMSNLLSIVKLYQIDLACNSDTTQSVTFVINTYPYRLNQAVEYRLIEAVKQYIGSVVDTKITHEPLSKLSIGYMVGLGYTQYVLYSLSDWCEHHFTNEDNFENMAGKYNFAVVAPRIARPLVVEVEQELRERNLTEEDPFELTRVVFATMMDLSFLPAESFSLLDASKIEAAMAASI